MSTVIKFRLWSDSQNKYVDGTFMIVSTEGALYSLDKAYVIEQYTGLTDQNGKEIYEGDILETCCGKAEVYFDDELLMYRVKVRHGGTMPLVSKKSKRQFDYEIIGNIHENPELLEYK